MSMPFINEEFTFTQPDGTPLEVRGTGNQYFATFETLDGFTIVQDPVSNFYHYARPADNGEGLVPAGIRAGAVDPERIGIEPGLSAPLTELGRIGAMTGLPRETTRWEERWAQRRETLRLVEAAAAAGLMLAPPQRDTVGTFVGLTLLIDFADYPATISQAEIEAFCNQPGYSGFGNKGSVRDYFLDISEGKLDYSNIVLPYYRARYPRSYYTNPTVTYPLRAQELIQEAIDHLVAQGFDASGLRSDDGDFVYALNVFYAGRRSNNWSQGLWPHASKLRVPRRLGPAKIVADYQVTDIGDELSLGTFCHENGHMVCDFPDLYDYGGESSGAGKFCLMCAGGSRPREKDPTQVGAYLKLAAGWATTVTDLATVQNAGLAAGANEFAIYRKSATEYFLIENRAAAGRDAQLEANGLAVWHVDELGSNNYEMGTATRHYECALVQADGLRQLERLRNYAGDDADLFKAGHNDTLSGATNPDSNWWDGTASGLRLRQIGAAGPNMSFTVG